MKSHYLNVVLAMTTLTVFGPVGCGMESTPATDQPPAAASKADSALSQDSLHFRGNISLTSQVFLMRSGNPNHPDTEKAGVTKGLALFGADAIGITTYNSIAYGTNRTTIELNLTTGVLARKVETYPPQEQETLLPPDQDGEATAYVGLLIDLKAIIARVAEGNMYPAWGFNYPPVPELQIAIAYVQSLITTLSNGGTLGAEVDGKCYAYCTNGYSDDPDYDGWGWANEQSCIVKGYTRDSRKGCFAGASQGPQSDTHFGRDLALTSQVFEMEAGSPNHPGTLKAGVKKGLELFGADAIGISVFRSESYGLNATRIELDLASGTISKTVHYGPPVPQETTVKAPDQGGDKAAYQSLVREMKDVVSQVASGNVDPQWGFNFPPAPELQATIDYLQFVLDKIG